MNTNMINTPRSRLISQQAYIKKMVRERNRVGTVAGLGRSVHEGTSMVAAILRHAIMMTGIVGLVGIAVGATTECRLYHQILNWVTSFFI